MTKRISPSPARVVFVLLISTAVFASGCNRQPPSSEPSAETSPATSPNSESPSGNPSPSALPLPPGPGPAWVSFETGANVKAMALNKGQLWMGLSNGMIRYDTRTLDDHEIFTPDSTGGGLMSKGIYTLKVDGRGNKWIGTYGGGMTRYDGNTWKTYTVADGLGDQWVYDIEFDGPLMWVATWKGVSVYDGKTFKNYTEEDGLLDKWVYAITLDQDHVFWFGTESGVNSFDGKNWASYTHKDGLGADLGAPPSVPSETTGEGNKQGSQAEKDISKDASVEDYGADYGSSSVAHHANPSKGNTGSNSNFVISAAVDHQNRKWFGTWGAGLSRFDGSTWVTFTKKDGLGGNFIHTVEVDSEGRVWAGTNGGASWYDGLRWRNFSKADGLVDDNVFSIVFDPNGDRWFGTWRGISRHRGNLPL